MSSDAAAFKEFNNGYDRYAESYRIYRFIDEVTQDSSSNWITQFDTAAEVLETLDKQLPVFLGEEFPDRILLPDVRVLANIPHIYTSADLDRSPRYRDTNRASLVAQQQLSRRPDSCGPQLVRIQRCIDETMNRYTEAMVQDMNVALGDGREDARFYAADTTTETMRSDAWRRNVYLRRVLTGSERVARHGNLGFSKYIRFVILMNPLDALANDDWRETFSMLTRDHQKWGIRLGFLSRHTLPFEQHDRLLNFYVVPGATASVNDPFAGMILDYRHDFDQAKVSDYVEYCQMGIYLTQVTTRCRIGGNGRLSSESG